MKVTILMMLPLYFGQVRQTIISTPENVALHRGASTELICRANSGSSVSSWAFTAYQGSAKDVTIFSREIGMVLVSNRTSFQEIIDKDGFFNIKTDSVQPRDAGVYTCNIRLKEGEGLRIVRRSAHLIVLDSAPNCTAIDYSANYRKFKRLSCIVGFRGDWAPVMEWRQGGFNGTIVTTGVQNNTTSNFVSQSISISVDDGEENAIKCIIFFFAYMGTVSATATNIPNYIFTWPDQSNGLPGELPAPANVVVIKGSNSTMVCKKFSAFTVYNWTFTAAESSTVSVIFSRDMGINPKFPRHHHSDDHASSKLSIKSTQLEDAGTYTCTKPAPANSFSGIIQESAQLIVFESDPKCSEKEQQEDINGHREVIFYLNCTVAFRGNWAPLMEWRFTDAHGEIIEHGVNMSTAMNHNVKSSLRLVASTTRQNAKFVCRTFFGNIHSRVSDSAKNIPYYNYTWTSSVINESNDVSLVTLIVSLAVVVMSILVALIVYHIFFKSFLAGQHRAPPAVMTPSFQMVQESDYAAIREIETITALRTGQPITEQRPATDEEEIHVYHSVAYGELLGSEDLPPHYYRKLPSASPSIIEGSSELHSYVNVPVMVDLPTPSAAILSDGNIQ